MIFDSVNDALDYGRKYACIYADPPWSFNSWSDKGKNRSPNSLVNQKGLAERHYSVMDMNDINELRVEEIADKDCVLFMWVVDCQLPQCIEVGEKWGFTYKTVAFTWVKHTPEGNGYHVGLGYWTRSNPEMCLMFTKGSPKRKSASVRQLVVSKRREHSRKPDEVYERIEALINGPYIEIFGRQERREWDVIGNQVGKFEKSIYNDNYFRAGMLL